MKERRFDPSRLDVRAFARAGAELAGEWPQSSMPRLCAGLERPPADLGVAAVRWSARGETRPRPAQDADIWLHVNASTRVRLVCQRCLLPLELPLSVQRSFLFVADEAEAERLDEEVEDDVLALTPRFDLVGLIEDELILALPIVPRHETCPEPLPAGTGPADEPSRENPFAVLEVLRTPGERP